MHKVKLPHEKSIVFPEKKDGDITPLPIPPFFAHSPLTAP